MHTIHFGGNFIYDIPVLDREDHYMEYNAVHDYSFDGALSVNDAWSVSVIMNMPDVADYLDMVK